MERLDIKEGWIHEGWFRHEGELLFHLRDRQDGRQLLGDRIRVLQDRGKLREGQSGDTSQVNIYQEDIFKKSSGYSHQESLEKHQEDSVVFEEHFLCLRTYLHCRW